MATVIDALVVTLGLDPTAYKAGSAEVKRDSAAMRDQIKADAEATESAAKASADTSIKAKTAVTEAERKQAIEEAKTRKDREEGNKQLVEGNKKVGESFSGIRRELFATLAALVGANALKNFVVSTVNDFNGLSIAAQNAGINVAEVFAFGATVERSGGNRDAARASLTALASAMQTWRTLGQASGDLRYGFSQIGGSLSDDPAEIFEKYSKWAEGKDQARVTQIGRQLGFDEGSINLAMKGAKNFSEEMKKSYALGVPTEEDIEAVRRLKQEFTELKQAIGGAAREMLVSASPALTKMIDKTTELIQGNREATKWVLGLGSAFTILGGIWAAIKVPAWLARLLGIGGTVARAAPAVAGAAGAGMALPSIGSLGIGGAVVAVGMSIPSGGETGEDNRMAERWNAYRAAKNAGKSDAEVRAAFMSGSANISTVAGRQAQAKAYFMSQGWSEANASGMVAGMTAENDTLDPHRPNPYSAGKSHAYGVGQWLVARQKDFKDWSGIDIQKSTFEQQLAFIQYELTQGKEIEAGNAIRGSANRNFAAYNYLAEYMRPGKGLYGDVRRAGKALPAITSIGTVNVYSNASDGKGLARDFRKEVTNKAAYVQQANSGVQ